MIRTGYSFRTAVGHLPEVLSRLREMSWPAFPIADRENTFGFVNWTKLCKKEELTPIYGVELPVSSDRCAKKPDVDFWVFLATERLSSISDLVYLATKQGMLSYNEALAAEGVVKIAQERCQVSFVDYSSPLLYQALTPATPVGLYRMAARAGASFLSMPRNSYPRESDLEFYRVLLGRHRASTQTYPQHIVSDDELKRSQPLIDADYERAIENRLEVLSLCRAKLETAKLLRFPSDKTLRQMCEEGAERLGVDLTNEVYRQRLDKELRLIEEKDFADYFFIIADLVAWAKKIMVVGPARGSSCGSLACYLLGITAIDPIPHGLIFERFIDITRADLPDIDLDFSDAKRQEVLDYAERKYGDRVARLSSVAIFQPRSALAKVGASLKIPSWQITAVSETAIKRSMGDSRKGSTIDDTLSETDAGRRMIGDFPESRIVARFEGHPDHSGIHAAGLIVSDRPVREYVAVNATNKTAMCNKYDAEALNLLKIDVLGLTQLSIFEQTMRLIGREPVSGWLEKLPLDDAEAFRVLNERKFCGIFQFGEPAMRGLGKQMTFESIDDIVAAGALVRPGPLSSGGTGLWVERRSGRAAVSYPHPLLEEYMRDTYGVMVYQEQVLRIGREIGDLSWADVTALRKAMSKSLGKEYFDQFGDRWKSAAEAKGMPREVASKFWDEMCQFGAWAFNKAHSVSYAYITYWSAYLKAHYPLEFAAATLDAEASPEKQIELLRELSREGVGYLPIDPERSTDHWQVLSNERLLGPLTNIKGIGPSKCMMIMNSRRPMAKKLSASLVKMLETARTSIDSLYPIRDRVAQLYPNGELKNKITSPISPVPEIQPGVSGDKVVIVVANKVIPKDENEPVKVAKRGYSLSPPTKALIMFVRDDDDEVMAKVNRFRYQDFGSRIQEAGRPGRVIFALKGSVPQNFRMLDVENFKILGEMDV